MPYILQRFPNAESHQLPLTHPSEVRSFDVYPTNNPAPLRAVTPVGGSQPTTTDISMGRIVSREEFNLQRPYTAEINDEIGRHHVSISPLLKSEMLYPYAPDYTHKSANNLTGIPDIYIYENFNSELEIAFPKWEVDEHIRQFREAGIPQL